MAANRQAPGVECRLVGERKDDDVLPTHDGHHVLLVVVLERCVDAAELFQSEHG